MVKNNHLEQRMTVKARVTFYTSNKTYKEAEKALEMIVNEANKSLTNQSQVIKMDIVSVEKLLF